MLLSQKLLANPKMITIDQEDLLDKSEANAIRAFFLTYLKRATKYVVPTSIFDGDFAITETEVSRDYSNSGGVLLFGAVATATLSELWIKTTVLSQYEIDSSFFFFFYLSVPLYEQTPTRYMVHL